MEAAGILNLSLCISQAVTDINLKQVTVQQRQKVATIEHPTRLNQQLTLLTLLCQIAQQL